MLMPETACVSCAKSEGWRTDVCAGMWRSGNSGSRSWPVTLTWRYSSPSTKYHCTHPAETLLFLPLRFTISHLTLPIFAHCFCCLYRPLSRHINPWKHYTPLAAAWWAVNTWPSKRAVVTRDILRHGKEIWTRAKPSQHTDNLDRLSQNVLAAARPPRNNPKPLAVNLRSGRPHTRRVRRRKSVSQT